MAADYSLTFIKGDTLQRVITLTNQSPSTPINLTGSTAIWTIEPRDAAQFDWHASDSTLLITNAAAGEITLSVPASVTASYTWRNARHCLRVTDSLGKIRTYLTGYVTAKPC